MNKRHIPFLVFFIWVMANQSLAAPTSLSGEVEAGSEDNHASIRIMNNTSTPVEGVTITVGITPMFIKDVVITPSTIQTIAPRQSKVIDISFNVDSELQEDQNARVTFQMSTVKGKLETNTATLNLVVKTLAGEAVVSDGHYYKLV